MVYKGQILFASTNKGKFKEASALCAEHGLKLVSPYEVAGNGPVPDVDENQGTYVGNCRLKAEAFFAWSGLPSLADDTGLEVAALNGRPGVHSARYSGPDANGLKNNEKLLSELATLGAGQQKPVDRSARFVCKLVLAFGNGEYLEADGELPGSIGVDMRGGGGFGYDCVFQVDGYGRTLAQLKEKGVPVKTHRILALEKMIGMLEMRGS